jgi:hypothetical protein
LLGARKVTSQPAHWRRETLRIHAKNSAQSGPRVENSPAKAASPPWYWHCPQQVHEVVMGRVLRSTCLAVMFAAVPGLYAQSSSRPTWRVGEAPAEYQPLISRADVVIDAMLDALLWELNAGLEQGGPTLAIKSCHIDSTRVSQRIGRELGVAAGRTSDRLRNPTNAPRAWAAPLVKEYAGRQAREVDGVVVDLGDKVGVMRPIAQRPICKACHGRPDTFATAVKAELKERYPVDRAVGFEDGQIRGWFWVEVRKQR